MEPFSFIKHLHSVHLALRSTPVCEKLLYPKVIINGSEAGGVASSSSAAVFVGSLVLVAMLACFLLLVVVA